MTPIARLTGYEMRVEGPKSRSLCDYLTEQLDLNTMKGDFGSVEALCTRASEDAVPIIRTWLQRNNLSSQGVRVSLRLPEVASDFILYGG